ncbi:MAG: type III pantothenate kinase [Planctomycetes bacterium]|nr:type III pantothenate kinase [Planctomycetota bacterium]
MNNPNRTNGPNGLTVLTISLGNTNCHIAVFKDNKMVGRGIISTKDAGKISRNKHLKALSRAKIDRALMVSTNPKAEKYLAQWVKKSFGLKLLKAGRDFKVPMPVRVKEPGKVGLDRLLNAFAAYQKKKKLTLVIDFGTAVTFDVVSARGEFLGGAIAAGLATMARALHNDCALLPLIKPKRAKKAIGKNTEEAMNSGIYLGWMGMTKYLVERITVELGKKPYVIATGGDAALIKGAFKGIDEIMPDLTLEGLVLAYCAGNHKK